MSDSTRLQPDPEALLGALATGECTDAQLEALGELLATDTPTARYLAQRVRNTLMIRGWVQAQGDTRFAKETVELIARLRRDSGIHFVADTMQRVRATAASDDQTATSSPAARTTRRTPGRLAPRQRHTRIVPYVIVALASAACVLAAFHIGLLRAPDQNASAMREQPAPKIEPQTPAAEIVAATDARLSSSQPLKPGDILRAGDEIVTGPAGVVTARYGDGTSLTLRAKSQLALLPGQALAGAKDLSKSLELRAGELDADVAAQPPGLPAVLVTPQSRVEVLGTKFGVSASDARTRLQMREGKVRFSPRDGSDPREVLADYVAFAGKQGVVVRPMRVRDGLVALYEFREGMGDSVQDVSGVEPRADLVRAKDGQIEWTANGLTVKTEHAMGAGAALFAKHNGAMRKGARFTVETWFYVPAGDPQQQRNIHLAHIGMASQGTAIVAGTTAQLRHSVDVYDEAQGNFVYSEGALIAALDEGEARAAKRQEHVKDLLAMINRADAGFQLCGYISDSDPKKRRAAYPLTYRLLAIYDRPLTADEVRRNYEAGPTPWE
jgi:ferric-dicitrate binding protein FerR (iron transport regulator)